MPESDGVLPENFDWLLLVLCTFTIVSILILSYFWYNNYIGNSLGVTGIWIIVTLVSVCFSYYRSKSNYNQTEEELGLLEEQVDEMRKKRLRPEYKERVEKIDSAIDRIDDNLSRLSGENFTTTFHPILKFEKLDPHHQDYFKTEHPKFLEKLNKQEELEEQLTKSHEKVRKEIREHVKRYVDEKSNAESNPYEWTLEKIVTCSRPDKEEVRKKFAVHPKEDFEIQNDIIATHTGGSNPGIFFHPPQPEFMEEYKNDLQEMKDYFILSKRKLIEIREEQKEDDL